MPKSEIAMVGMVSLKMYSSTITNYLFKYVVSILSHLSQC